MICPLSSAPRTKADASPKPARQPAAHQLSSLWPTAVMMEFGFGSCEEAFSLLKRVAPSLVNCPERTYLGRQRSQDTTEGHPDRQNCRSPRVRPSSPPTCISCPDLPGPSASPTPRATPSPSGPPCYPGGRSESEREMKSCANLLA